MRLNEDRRKFDSHRQLRQNSSLWAAQNPHCLIGENLTLIQLLQNHLNEHTLTLEGYVDWWKLMETSKRYAESPVLAALGFYLDYNICVWRRPSKTTQSMNFASLFSSV